MTAYEVDIYVRDAAGEVVRERRLVMEAREGETLEVWVNDRLKYEDEGENPE